MGHVIWPISFGPYDIMSSTWDAAHMIWAISHIIWDVGCGINDVSGGPQNVVLFWGFALVFGWFKSIPRGFVVVVMQPWRNHAKSFSALPNPRNHPPAPHQPHYTVTVLSVLAESIEGPRRPGTCRGGPRGRGGAAPGAGRGGGGG